MKKTMLPQFQMAENELKLASEHGNKEADE